MTKNLPIKIEECPIVDALFEIRFNSKGFKGAVFGLIYDSIKSYFPNDPISLPILQIPEPLREQDPSLKHKPHYRLENDKYIVQIGQDVLTISQRMPYRGWEEFFDYINQLLKVIIKEDIIKDVFRLGLRYVNIFNGEILSKLTFDISIPNVNLIKDNTSIRTEIKDGSFMNTLQITNNTEINFNGSNSISSIIDIDTYKTYTDNQFLLNFEDEINEAHKSEKTLFYSILNDRFIKTLNPIY